MARHHHHHRRHRRHNPFGLNSGVVKDAAFNASGALASLYVGNLLNLSGWAGVGATGAVAVGLGMVGKALGPGAAEELMKGGLTAAIIQALKQLGIGQSLGLGLYGPSYFALPTASDQYLRAYAPGMQGNRGAGTIYFPGPGSAPVPALPAAAAGKGMHGYRFRSRYAGNF